MRPRSPPNAGRSLCARPGAVTTTVAPDDQPTRSPPRSPGGDQAENSAGEIHQEAGTDHCTGPPESTCLARPQAAGNPFGLRHPGLQIVWCRSAAENVSLLLYSHGHGDAPPRWHFVFFRLISVISSPAFSRCCRDLLLQLFPTIAYPVVVGGRRGGCGCHSCIRHHSNCPSRSSTDGPGRQRRGARPAGAINARGPRIGTG